jgi:hypothetical protein
MPAMAQEHPLPVSSSCEPQLHSDQQRAYQDVLQTLNQDNIPYAVSGAFALHHHTGIWRTTKDLDIFLTPRNAPLALDALRAAGFQCEICDPVWLAKAHRDDFFIDLITGMSNATITVTDAWIARSKPDRILDMPSRVLAAEELLASKLFIMRRERFDGADISHIVYATEGRLDWGRLLELAGSHWEVLLWSLMLFRYVYPAHSHYVPLVVWTQLINNLMLRLLNPDASARFRGSLVDENMFAIDVNEWSLDDLLTEYRARAPKIEWQQQNGSNSHHPPPTEDAA